MIAWSGSEDDITGGDSSHRISLLTNLQAAYTGTVSSSTSNTAITSIMNINPSDSSQANSYASTIVNNSLGAEININSSLE